MLHHSPHTAAINVSFWAVWLVQCLHWAQEEARDDQNVLAWNEAKETKCDFFTVTSYRYQMMWIQSWRIWSEMTMTGAESRSRAWSTVQYRQRVKKTKINGQSRVSGCEKDVRKWEIEIDGKEGGNRVRAREMQMEPVLERGEEERGSVRGKKGGKLRGCVALSSASWQGLTLN